MAHVDFSAVAMTQRKYKLPPCGTSLAPMLLSVLSACLPIGRFKIRHYIYHITYYVKIMCIFGLYFSLMLCWCGCCHRRWFWLRRTPCLNPYWAGRFERRSCSFGKND